MKKSIILIILFSFLGITYFYREEIVRYYYQDIVYKNADVSIENVNDYYRDYDFLYLQNTNNFSPHNEQDIINIIYTFLNAGNNKITFYCPSEYETCIKDVKKIANNQMILSTINNYVHPYNSFSNFATETDNFGKVTLKIKKNYSQSDIAIINTNIKKVEQELFDSSLSTYDQIQVIHDYIINNTKYDSNRTDHNIIEYKSDIAYGPLLEGYAICGGYSDLMELFLEDLDIKSYKVSTNDHVWNVVNLYDKWYHIDLTWDDPVTNTKDDLLEHNYFLIGTDKLLEIEPTQHMFNRNYYKEL